MKYRKHEVIYFEGEKMKYIDYYMYSIFNIKMREVNNHKNFIDTSLKSTETTTKKLLTLNKG